MKHTILLKIGQQWIVKQQGIDLKDVKEVLDNFIELYGRDRLRLLKEVDIQL